MAYIGNTPAEKFSAFSKQDFTTSATTSYTLDNAVSNANEIALFINHVRQEPTTAYTAAGTALTLTSATTSSDDMYCVFIGKAVQTVTPGNNTITNAMIVDGAIDNAALSSGSFSNITGTGTLTDFTSTGIDDNADATAITIDSSENVTLSNDLVIPDKIVHDGDTNTAIRFPAADTITYETGGSERMRIGGGVLLATTTQRDGAPLTVYGNGVAQIVCEASASSNGFTAIFFRNPSGTQGQIITNASSVAYQTTSDHRLKENVVSMTNATDRLKQLKPKRFNFIADVDTTVDGFLAHEVQSVVPEAISGTHNEVDADGNPVYQGIDQAKLVPLLVKTIQELEARITTLETKVTALENA